MKFWSSVRAFRKKLKSFESRWKLGSETSNMVVKTVTSMQTSNAGDALRELDSQKMVTSEPFVLIRVAT